MTIGHFYRKSIAEAEFFVKDRLRYCFSVAANAKPKVSERTKRRRPKGTVRTAAIEAAQAAITKAGVPDFTLRQIADRIGVVHSALYRHFPNRASLVAAVAEQGFRALLLQVDQALSEAPIGAAACLKHLCHTYLRFALSNAPLYKVMFGPEVVPFDVEGTEFHTAASAVLEVALGAVASCQREGAVRGADPMAPGLVFWATLHGVAMLAIDGRLQLKLGLNGTVDQLLDLALEALLRGL